MNIRSSQGNEALIGLRQFLSLAAIIFAGMLLSGCLPKPSTVSTRHFVLAPMPPNAAASAAAEPFSVGIGFVKMPSYLSRDSMAVRKSATEIEYLDDVRWGERLDLGFRRTVAADLSSFLPSDRVYLADWARDQVAIAVSITVEQ